MSFDLLVVGAGISGSIMAREFAEAGKKILVLEKRKNVAGNIFDENKQGITVHKYGPHIFHTNIEEVNNYMNKYWTLNNFRNEVESLIKDKLVPIPFNFEGIDTFFYRERNNLKNKLISAYGNNSRVTIDKLLKSSDPEIIKLSNFIYKNVFENYTIKMWGVSPKLLDKNILTRVPVALSYSTKYFQDKYEGIPKYGYTNAIKSILNHDNIIVKTNFNALNSLILKDNKTYFNGKLYKGLIIYSGPIDELLEYKYGNLPYRSLFIDFKVINKTNFQKTAVVNYPADPQITRITEYKKMSKQLIKDKTIISIETPGAHDFNSKYFSIPYYPLRTAIGMKSYQKYANDINKYNNIILIGRLATYKYLNMDIAISTVLKLSKKLIKVVNNE